MATPQQLQATVLWVTKLALLTAGGRTPPTKQQIGLYATILSDELPSRVFCDESLNVVAAGCEYFPAFAVLKTGLETWDREYPAKPRIAPLMSENIQQRIDEILNNDAHKQRLAERAALVKADWSDPAKVRASAAKIGDDHPMREMLGKMLAGLVKRHAPENLGHLPPEFLQ